MVIASPRYLPVGSKLFVKLNACSQLTLYVPPLPAVEPPFVPAELFDEPPPHAARTDPERTATEMNQSFRIQVAASRPAGCVNGAFSTKAW
jgi:hypothetical protein